MDLLGKILIVLEVVSCLVGVFSFKKLKNSYWVFFPVYLFFIVLSEYVGWHLRVNHLISYNINFYNYLVIPTEFSFTFWLFYQAFKAGKYRWLPAVCTTVYFLCWIIDMAYLSKLRLSFYSFSYTIGNLVLLVLILWYFIQLVNSNAILTFRSNMMFWVSLGLLLYYLGSFPYYGLRNTIAYNFRELNITYSYIVLVLDCLMYLMFTFSFIWGKPNTKSL